MPAPVASGWSDRRVGLAPTGKAPPCHGARGNRTLAVTVEVGSAQPFGAALVRLTYRGGDATKVSRDQIFQLAADRVLRLVHNEREWVAHIPGTAAWGQ